MNYRFLKSCISIHSRMIFIIAVYRGMMVNETLAAPQIVWSIEQLLCSVTNQYENCSHGKARRMEEYNDASIVIVAVEIAWYKLLILFILSQKL